MNIEPLIHFMTSNFSKNTNSVPFVRWQLSRRNRGRGEPDFQTNRAEVAAQQCFTWSNPLLILNRIP